MDLWCMKWSMLKSLLITFKGPLIWHNSTTAIRCLILEYFWHHLRFQGPGDVKSQFRCQKWILHIKMNSDGPFKHRKSSTNKGLYDYLILWRQPSWIAYCNLMTEFQDDYLAIKCDLGSLVQEKIIKIKGLNHISRVLSQV